MKKLLLGGLTALLIGASTPTLSAGIEEKTHFQGLEQIDGLTTQERCSVGYAESLVSKKYLLPEIYFYSTNFVREQVAEKAPEIIDSFETKFLRNNPKFDYGHYFVFLPDSEDCRNLPLEEMWFVPCEDPIVRETLRDIGYIYFNSLDQDEINRLVNTFDDVDFIGGKGDVMTAHPSFYSYFYSLGGENIDFESAVDMAREQFASTFIYHILGYNYKQDDDLFKIKLNNVERVLERFRSSSEFPSSLQE